MPVLTNEDPESLVLSESSQPEESLPQESGGEEEEPDEPEEILLPDKLIAITFDDGPHHENTDKLLDILEREDVKATFFCVGVNIERNREVLQRTAEAGHQLASHTYTHARLTDLDEASLRSELDNTTALIEEVTGVRISAMRPPFGSINEDVQAAAGMPVILWSIDPRDWETKDADLVYEAVVADVKDGDIILLHDPYVTSVEAAEKIIVELKSRGFGFVTVEKLIELRQGEAVPGQKYRRVDDTISESGDFLEED